MLQENAHAKIERVDLALGGSMQQVRGLRERCLSFLVESVEHPQRVDRSVEIGTAALAANAGEPFVEELPQCLLEARDPFLSLETKILHVRLVDELVHLE